MSVSRDFLALRFRSILFVGLAVFLVSGLSGCESLRVKLALRDFARAAKRRDKKRLSSRSTDRLTRLVWSRIPESLWKARWPSGGKSRSSKNSRGGSVKVSVHLQGRRARAKVLWKGLELDFVLVKQKGWKIDDLAVGWKTGHVESRIDLTRDIEPILAVYAFAMAAYHGKRDEMARWASPKLLAGGWDTLPASLFERVSARLRAPSKGPSTGPSDKVAAVFFQRGSDKGIRRLGLTMTSGRRLAVTVVQSRKGWLVEEALFVEPRESGGLRRMRLSHLLAAAKALYDLGKKLASSDLVDLRSIRSRIESKSSQGLAGHPRSRVRKARKQSRPGRSSGMLSEMLSRLSLLDFDDEPHHLWVTFTWKDAKGRIDFSSRSGRWSVADARLDRKGRSIRLADALSMRDLLVSLMKAALSTDIPRIQSLSSRDLNRRVWSRLGPLARLKKRLLGGGLDELLGFAALPKNVFAKLGFGARVALLAKRLASGRLRLVGLWRDGTKAFLVIRIGSVPVTVRAEIDGGKWRLDDVAWKVGGRRISLKERAGTLLGAWFGSSAARP